MNKLTLIGREAVQRIRVITALLTD